MRIRELTAIHARIPLKRPVRHASHSRSENDTLLVRCRLEGGSLGWGEGLPRPYVTGETIESAWQHFHEFDVRLLAEDIDDVSQLAALLDRIAIPRPGDQRDCFGNSVRCAIELAVADAFCRAFDLPVSQFLYHLPELEPIRRQAEIVRYSGALTGDTPRKLLTKASLFRLTGFRQCKLKVGFSEDVDRRNVRWVRCTLGPSIALRIDANEAWQPDDLSSKFAWLEQANVVAVEQPVPHHRVRELASVRRDLSIPIMLDESLCTATDAQQAIEEGLCDLFNLRLSKCGGLLPVVRLARLAYDAGLGYQLGCQVGETGILSAAGRHVATTLDSLFAVEGSFDRFLVREPLTTEDLTFGWGGAAAAIRSPGLGFTLDEAALLRVTKRESGISV